MSFRLPLLLTLLHSAAAAQVFVAGLGGAVSLSGAAAATASPVSASNYQASIGPALHAAAGYHFNDWVSAQVGYVWGRNRVTTTEIAGLTFSQSSQTVPRHALGVDLMVYFRARRSRVRPYLSVGPGLIRFPTATKPALHFAVGVDVTPRAGWAIRYTFSETMSANPLGEALRPRAGQQLMNFRNLIGIVKTF